MRLATFATVAGMLGACAQERVEADDPRLGEQGLVRFTGGGCSGSTVMAVGSHATLKMEPAQGQQLPALSVDSTDPLVIGAALGELPDDLKLEAHSEGETRIQLHDAAGLYDAIALRAEPAGAVKFQLVPRVFAGASVDVVVTDVYGRCGSDACPLFGDGFLGWTSDPSASLSLRLDDRGAATFTAGAPSEVRVRGREPLTGALLIDAVLDVVPVAGVTGLRATVRTIPLEEGEQPREFPLADGAVAPDSAFCIQLEALREGQLAVPLSRRDVEWSVAGALVTPVAIDHGSEPLGSVFVAGADPGSVALSVSIPLLERSEAFDLRVATP